MINNGFKDIIISKNERILLMKIIKTIKLGITALIIGCIAGIILSLLTGKPELISMFSDIVITILITIGILYLILYLWAKVYCRQHPEQWEEYKKQHPEKFKNKS